jgi:hypothetical protein
MTSILAGLRAKCRYTGWWRTGTYLFFTVLLGRIGFQLNCAYLRQMDSRSTHAMPAGFSASLARKLDDLGEQDIAVLLTYGGAKLKEQFHSAFAAGKVCIVLRSVAEELAAVCWAENVDAFAPCTSNPCVLVSRCFTLPRFRGLRLYPAALKVMDHLLPDEMLRLTQIVIECSAFNYPSRSGILKAGFRFCGMAMEFGRMRSTWQRNS